MRESGNVVVLKPGVERPSHRVNYMGQYAETSPDYFSVKVMQLKKPFSEVTRIEKNREKCQLGDIVQFST